MARNFGCRASALLEIGDPVVAFDFDRATSFRLLTYDNKRERDKARTVGLAVGAAFAGKPLEFDDEEDDVEAVTW